MIAHMQIFALLLPRSKSVPSFQFLNGTTRNVKKFNLILMFNVGDTKTNVFKQIKNNDK